MEEGGSRITSIFGVIKLPQAFWASALTHKLYEVSALVMPGYKLGAKDPDRPNHNIAVGSLVMRLFAIHDADSDCAVDLFWETARVAFSLGVL